MKKFKRDKGYFVYILECQDKTYYTGYTNDLKKRVKEHNDSKRGAKSLRGKLPVKLVYAKEYRYYKKAIQEERRIKKLRREQKEELVNKFGKNAKLTSNSNRLKNLPAAHFSHQSSECHPKVFIKTFG